MYAQLCFHSFVYCLLCFGYLCMCAFLTHKGNSVLYALVYICIHCSVCRFHNHFASNGFCNQTSISDNSTACGNMAGKSLSKTLTYLLRHGARDAGLRMDRFGWVRLDFLLALRQFKDVTANDIRILVCNDRKNASRCAKPTIVSPSELHKAIP